MPGERRKIAFCHVVGIRRQDLGGNSARVSELVASIWSQVISTFSTGPPSRQNNRNSANVMVGVRLASIEGQSGPRNSKNPVGLVSPLSELSADGAGSLLWPQCASPVTQKTKKTKLRRTTQSIGIGPEDVLKTGRGSAISIRQLTALELHRPLQIQRVT